MAHSNYTLTDRLVWNRKDKSFLLIQKAHWKNVKLDIVKRDIHHQKPELRNLVKYILSPWLFIAPQDKMGFWGNSEYGIDNWWNNDQKDKYRYSCTLFGKREQSINKIKSLILKYEPQFIYTFNAYLKNRNNNLYTLFDIYAIYRMWKKYTYETEMLVKLGYHKLATQKSIYKLSTPKKKEIIDYIRQNPTLDKSCSICDIKEFMLDVENHDFFVKCKQSKPLYDYIYKLCGENAENWELKRKLDYYFDYKSMAKECGKDLKDKYWLYPNDLTEKHNLVMEQVNAIREANRLAKIEKSKQEKLEREKQVNENLKAIPQLKAEINGFSLYLANSMEDIKEQADKLKQCLITCRYYEKVADKKSLLIFIRKHNEPIATCEIGYDKTIKQFYCDEHDRNNCNPSQELKDIANSYIANLQINNNKQIKYAY